MSVPQVSEKKQVGSRIESRDDNPSDGNSRNDDNDEFAVEEVVEARVEIFANLNRLRVIIHYQDDELLEDDVASADDEFGENVAYELRKCSGLTGEASGAFTMFAASKPHPPQGVKKMGFATSGHERH